MTKKRSDEAGKVFRTMMVARFTAQVFVHNYLKNNEI